MPIRWTVRRAGAWMGALALALIVPLAGMPGATLATPSAQALPAPPPESLDTAPRDGAAVQALKPAHAKLDATLNSLLTTPAGPQVAATAPDALVVHIAVDPADQATVRAQVAELGGEATIASTAGDILQAWMPVQALPALAELTTVQMVRQPAMPFATTPELTAGAVASEALPLLGVPRWHAAGYTGQGMRVGLIELDFQGYEALLGTELPPADRVIYRDFGDPRNPWGRGPYGTAQAETLHDIVPDATLYLARITNYLEFEQAALWMQREGVTVIGSYLGWYNLDPGDGTGFLADVVARTRAAGVTWITSAQHLRLQHWGGNAYDFDGDGYLAVEGSRQINRFRDPIPPGVSIMVYARWSDWSSVNQDVDLVIVRWNGRFWEPFAEARDDQNGLPGQRPVENLEVVSRGPTTYYGVALRSHRVNRIVNVDVFSAGQLFFEPTAVRSITNLGDAPGGITVGAVEAWAPFESLDYVGIGPTNGDGGVRDGGLRKPDLVSYAGVSTATYPDRMFSGTGAAVAHAAGVAALVRDAYPAFNPDDVRRYLIAGAFDRNAEGWDALTGYGMLALGTPPDNYTPPFDFTADRRSDIFWRNDRPGRSLIVPMDGTQPLDTLALPPLANSGWQAVSVGDYNGDGRADVLWLNLLNRQLEVRLTGRSAAPTRWRLQPGWIVAGSADFNGDGVDDILFRNPRSGINCVWLIRNGALLRAYAIDSAATRWQVAGLGDLDGDGAADVLWRSRESGRHQRWLLNGRLVESKQWLRVAPLPEWYLAGLADFDGDGTADLLWTSRSGGPVWVDYMRDGQAIRSVQIDVNRNPRYRIVATGDYNGDRRADVLWRDMRNGGLYLSLHDGAVILDHRAVDGAGTRWSVVGPSTYDGERLLAAGGTAPLAEILREGAVQQTDPDLAPDDPDAPVSERPSDPNPGAPSDPRTPDPGTPEDDASEPIDTVVLPEAATIEEITALVLAQMLDEQGTRIYLPLLR